MNQSQPLSDEGRRFFIEQATDLQKRNQPAILETSTEHSVITGRVVNVDGGGLVFQQSDTGYRNCLPWEKVDKLVAIPTGQQTQTQQQQSYAQSAGQSRY